MAKLPLPAARDAAPSETDADVRRPPPPERGGVLKPAFFLTVLAVAAGLGLGVHLVRYAQIADAGQQRETTTGGRTRSPDVEALSPETDRDQSDRASRRLAPPRRRHRLRGRDAQLGHRLCGNIRGSSRFPEDAEGRAARRGLPSFNTSAKTSGIGWPSVRVATCATSSSKVWSSSEENPARHPFAGCHEHAGPCANFRSWRQHTGSRFVDSRRRGVGPPAESSSWWRS